VLFFTNLGRVYRLKGYEVPDGSRVSKGMNIANLLPVSQDEKITAMIRVPEYEEGHYLVMVTKNGTVKRTSLDQYNTARKGGVIGILLDEGDELVGVLLTDGTADILCGTSGGNAIRFNETDSRPMGRSAHGVRAIRLGVNDEVVGISRLTGIGRLLAVTENGFGKRVELDEYRSQNRGGKGLISYNVNEKTGRVAGIRVVEDTDDALFISSDGVIIRVPVTEIPIYSRYAQGVHVMRVAEGTQVVTVASAPHEDEDEDEDETETETEDNIEAETQGAPETPTETPPENVTE